MSTYTVCTRTVHSRLTYENECAHSLQEHRYAQIGCKVQCFTISKVHYYVLQLAQQAMIVIRMMQYEMCANSMCANSSVRNFDVRKFSVRKVGLLVEAIVAAGLSFINLFLNFKNI